MCESLLRENPNLTVSPGLATSWSHPNPVTWIYQIRQGVKFWDGHTMTPADVVYSLKRNLDPKLGGYYFLYYRNVKSIAQTGPHQVTVTLTRADNSFQADLVSPGGAINEAAYVRRVGTTDYGTPSGGLMCTGPFMLQKWSPGNDIVMVRNPHYWDPTYRAHASRVTFYFITNSSTLVEALRSGQIDGSYSLPPGSVGSLQSASDGHLHSSPTSLAMYQLDPDANILIRRALSLVIPRAAIAHDILQGNASPITLMLPPTAARTPEVSPAVAAIYRAVAARVPSQNLALAKKLVKQSRASRTPLVLAILQGDDTEAAIAAVVRSAAASIGLTIDVKSLPGPSFTNAFGSPQNRKGLSLLLDSNWYQFPTPLSNLGYYVGPAELDDLSNYQSPQIDANLAAAAATDNPTTQARYLAKTLLEIHAAAVVIPIVALNSISFLNNRLAGMALAQPYYMNSPWAALIGSAR